MVLVIEEVFVVEGVKDFFMDQIVMLMDTIFKGLLRRIRRMNVVSDGVTMRILSENAIM